MYIRNVVLKVNIHKNRKSVYFDIFNIGPHYESL